MITIGIIGCGYWGPNLVRNFNLLDDVTVAAVCDENQARLDIIRKQYPSIPTMTTRADDVLGAASIDAVVIATPVSTHFDLAHKALSQGKHVFVEKPFTARSDEARTLIDLAAKKNLQILVDHTFIYTGAVRIIKEYIDAGKLGDIYYFDSVRVNLGLFQHDVNVIWDLAPHDISIMDFLLNRHPRAVSATGVAHVDASQINTAYISAWYDNNVLGHIHVNWLAPVKVRRTLLSGSKKMIIYDDMEPSEKVKVYDRGVDVVHEKDAIYDLLIQYRTGDMLAPRVDLTEALRRASTEFRDCIVEGRPPLTDGHAGLRVIEIIEAANRSVEKKGQVIEIG